MCCCLFRFSKSPSMRDNKYKKLAVKLSRTNLLALNTKKMLDYVCGEFISQVKSEK